jgi:hypothetical protein
MTNNFIRAAALALLAFAVEIKSLAQSGPTSQKATADIAVAAKNVIVSLEDNQRGKLIFDFKDDQQRKRWSNLPTSFVKRGGLRMGDLTTPQRAAVMTLLETALSPQGYEKVQQIMEADETLKKTTGETIFGRDDYYLSFLGQPSAEEPWMIQFGGHHLGLNITLAGEHATLAPSHTGAQPAIYELEGKIIRPLGREADKAFALMRSLDEAQCKQALLGFEIRDLVLGPGRDGKMIQPEGIKGSALNEKQQEMLLDLAGEWTGMMNLALAKTKMDELKRNVAETWFAWSGPTEKDKAAYFRIQGPTVVIEYAPQRLGGDATKHTHTIYRDATNEYGKKWSAP